MAVTIVKILGKAKRANYNGETIHREDMVFIPSERGWFRIMDTSDHFTYRRKTGTYGSTLMCSCGSIAGVFNYEAYQRFQSANWGRILCCVSYVNTGRHADGSTG